MILLKTFQFEIMCFRLYLLSHEYRKSRGIVTRDILASSHECLVLSYEKKLILSSCTVSKSMKLRKLRTWHYG
jgi:hypothetical protein